MLSGCAKLKTYTYKYKFTISVRDQGQLKTVSQVVSVQESTTEERKAANPPKLCGEAAALQLRSGKTLFVLLKGVYHEQVSGQTQWQNSPTLVLLKRFGLETEWTYRSDSGIRLLPKINTEIDLQYYEMPDFVTFRNIRDPTTIQQVYSQNFEAVLGDGVTLERATLQVTNEEVTRGRLLAVIPWLDAKKDFIDGSRWGRTVQGYWSQYFVNCT